MDRSTDPAGGSTKPGARPAGGSTRSGARPAAGSTTPSARPAGGGIFGVIEGFYGRPWSAEQREELFGRLRDWGLNTYIYGPKDDLKLRAEWRSLYTDDEAAELGRLVEACAEAGIELNCAVAPGLDMGYRNEEDWRALERKVAQLASLGVSSFTLLFDDIPNVLPEVDRQHYTTFAAAQCAVANHLWGFLNERVTSPRLFFCPTEYCGRRAFPNVAASPYLAELGEALDPGVEVFWTGPEVVSETLPAESIREVARVLRRKPLIWDNFHANDYDIRRVYLGPYQGRDAQLAGEVSGIISNPNCEHEANFVPLRTFALYAADPASYDATQAFEKALDEWRPRFALHGGGVLGRFDLELLAHYLYLPFNLGERAEAFLTLTRELLGKPAAEWGEGFERLCRERLDVEALFDELTHLDNRELLYALYQYVWEVQAEVAVTVDYLAWLAAGPGAGERFGPPGGVPNTYRGGFAARVQRLLPTDDDGRFLEPGGWRMTDADAARVATDAPTFTIRPYRPEDLDAVYRVCLETGDSGKDATHLYDDPRALGHLYVGPYVTLEPELAFVLEDGEGVCGYVLGALDTLRFFEAFVAQWLPQLQERLHDPQGDPKGWSRDERIYHQLHHPRSFFPPQLEPFPSHLHIDLLERAQGRGNGGRMMRVLLAALTAKGSPGVHLGVGLANERAQGFYGHLGFREILRLPDALYMARELG